MTARATPTQRSSGTRRRGAGDNGARAWTATSSLATVSPARATAGRASTARAPSAGASAAEVVTARAPTPTVAELRVKARVCVGGAARGAHRWLRRQGEYLFMPAAIWATSAATGRSYIWIPECNVDVDGGCDDKGSPRRVLYRRVVHGEGRSGELQRLALGGGAGNGDADDSRNFQVFTPSSTSGRLHRRLRDNCAEFAGTDGVGDASVQRV